MFIVRCGFQSGLWNKRRSYLLHKKYSVFVCKKYKYTSCYLVTSEYSILQLSLRISSVIVFDLQPDACRFRLNIHKNLHATSLPEHDTAQCSWFLSSPGRTEDSNYNQRRMFFLCYTEYKNKKMNALLVTPCPVSLYHNHCSLVIALWSGHSVHSETKRMHIYVFSKDWL